MWNRRASRNAGQEKKKRRIGLPVILVLAVLLAAGTWIGLTLIGHSIEKPNITPSAQSLRDFDYEGIGALDPDSPEWAEKYGKDHPEAVAPGIVPEDAPTGTCTISVSCHTAASKGMAAQERWRDIVPASGVILEPVEVAFHQGEMVFDVLKNTLRERNIQMEFRGIIGSQYIEGIHNLYEFDGGPDSGWMFCVNGWYPNYGCGQYLVQEGDIIEWHYTCDLGRDLGQDWILR